MGGGELHDSMRSTGGTRREPKQRQLLGVSNHIIKLQLAGCHHFGTSSLSLSPSSLYPLLPQIFIIMTLAPPAEPSPPPPISDPGPSTSCESDDRDDPTTVALLASPYVATLPEAFDPTTATRLDYDRGTLV